MEGTTSKNAKLLAAAGFLFITMIWGGSFVVMKNSVDLVPPSYLLALRFTLAAVFMALAFPARMKKLDRESLTCGLIMGGFLTLAYLFQTYGIKYTTASKNAFITALYVVLVPFLYWRISKKRPGLNQITAGLVAVAGLALLTLKHESGINLGDALTFLCGVCFAIHMICTEEYAKRCDPILLAAVQVAAVGLFNWILAPFLDGPGAFDPSMLLQKSLILGLLYLSLICTTVGFLIQTVGQKYLSANTVSLLLSLEAVFGTLFSVIFLNEVLTGRMILGCVLMFSALLMSELHFTTPGKEVHG